jgi:hypothetical protein
VKLDGDLLKAIIRHRTVLEYWFCVVARTDYSLRAA